MTKNAQKLVQNVKKSHNWVVFGAKWTILLFILGCMLLMCGCAHKTPVETIADNATAQVIALEKTLAPECKTEAVMVEIAAVKEVIAGAPAACELQIQPIRTERNALALALMAIIALFVARFVKKVV